MVGFYLAMLDSVEEKDKFEELYRLYRQDMYKVAYSILKNSADAEDAVHEAFWSIANNFERVCKISRQEIKAYIVIIVKNASIDIYNKNSKKAKHSVELLDNTPVDIDLLEQYDYSQLVKVISELPQIYKDIIYTILKNYLQKIFQRC